VVPEQVCSDQLTALENMTTFVLALMAIAITVVAVEEQASEHCVEEDAAMKVARDELGGQGLLMRETLRSKEKATLEGTERHASAAVTEDREKHASAAVAVTKKKVEHASAVTERTRKGASLKEKEKHAVTDLEDGMESEEVDIDDELTTDGKQLWKSECPRFCTTSRKLKDRDWSEKCWMWACQLCPDYKENCEEILEDAPPDLCGKSCSKSAERMIKKGRSKSMCLWPNCQTCEGWKKKCEQ